MIKKLPSFVLVVRGECSHFCGSRVCLSLTYLKYCHTVNLSYHHFYFVSIVYFNWGRYSLVAFKTVSS